ncbi:hypothetical protein GGR51DRAFT_511404 [Nemania sp. FL0031]|nr:hypothetical protein GGR51DRAFT_511404 [Nemania sp. FL0031]
MPTCTNVNSTSASPRPDGASTHTLDVEEMPPPMPSSWRACTGSGEPMAAGRISLHASPSLSGGRSDARSTRPLEVPLRTKSAGRLRWPFLVLAVGEEDIVALPTARDGGFRRRWCFILVAAAVVVWMSVVRRVMTCRGLVGVVRDMRVGRHLARRCDIEGGIGSLLYMSS